MKKLLLIISTMLVTTLYATAKDHVIVIRGDYPNPKGKTEVVPDVNGESDTLTVTPGQNATLIQIEVKDNDGNVVSQHVINANQTTTVNVSTPFLPIGSALLQISDDEEVVYEEEE